MLYRLDDLHNLCLCLLIKAGLNPGNELLVVWAHDGGREHDCQKLAEALGFGVLGDGMVVKLLCLASKFRCLTTNEAEETLVDILDIPLVG